MINCEVGCQMTFLIIGGFIFVIGMYFGLRNSGNY